MKLLFDFFPIILFFIGFKLFGIYPATAIAIVASLLQLIIYRLKYNRFDKFQLIGFLMILVLGGATLIFQNPWFIKWKPTMIYWLTSVVFLVSTFVGQKPVIQKLMEQNLELPRLIWRRLNLAWATFFAIMGVINIYVAYQFSTDVWVNFKLFGGIGLTLFFVLLQALYLAKHVDSDLVDKSKATQEKN